MKRRSGIEDAAANVGSLPFRPEGEDGPDATLFRCALCGGRFTHGGLSCDACPLGARCGLVRCPHCGYQFPRSSGIMDWFRRVVRGEVGSR